MRLLIIVAVFVVFSFNSATATSYLGSLYHNGCWNKVNSPSYWPALQDSQECQKKAPGTDFYCPNGFSKELTQGTPIHLQGQFSWSVAPEGDTVDAYGNITKKDNEHPGIFYSLGEENEDTQNYYTDPRVSPSQPFPQHAESHAAGVILTQKGLGLELWNSDESSPDSPVWSFRADQCVLNACKEQINPGGTAGIKTIATPPLALASAYTEYLTPPPPGFELQANTQYTLKATLTDLGNDVVRLKGQLYEGSTLKQEGQVEFDKGRFLPTADEEDLRGCAFRAKSPAESESIRFFLYDHL